ncbi:hypothetical protein VTL71DRAFT_4486 [Oculimacula yallundae]|uniref:Uncharacterized protein n=1 Tax=Oculimacula yallundae TaxID=86028 RepID=A0ABR4C391_9HELO
MCLQQGEGRRGGLQFMIICRENLVRSWSPNSNSRWLVEGNGGALRSASRATNCGLCLLGRGKVLALLAQVKGVGTCFGMKTSKVWDEVWYVKLRGIRDISGMGELRRKCAASRKLILGADIGRRYPAQQADGTLPRCPTTPLCSLVAGQEDGGEKKAFRRNRNRTNLYR